MKQFKLASLLAIAFTALSLFPGASFAKDKEESTVKESKAEDGTKSVEIKLGSKELEMLDVDYDEVEIESDGASKFRMTGKANKVILDVSGLARIDLRGLDAKEVELDMSGAGRVRLKASKSYKLKASGFGEIYLYSDAPVKKRSVSGVVSISREKE